MSTAVGVAWPFSDHDSTLQKKKRCYKFVTLLHSVAYSHKAMRNKEFIFLFPCIFPNTERSLIETGAPVVPRYFLVLFRLISQVRRYHYQIWFSSLHIIHYSFITLPVAQYTLINWQPENQTTNINMNQNLCRLLLCVKYNKNLLRNITFSSTCFVPGHFTAHIWVFTCLAAEAVYIRTRCNSRVKCTWKFFYSVGNRDFFTREKCGPGVLAHYSFFNQSWN